MGKVNTLIEFMMNFSDKLSAVKTDKTKLIVRKP